MTVRHPADAGAIGAAEPARSGAAGEYDEPSRAALEPVRRDQIVLSPRARAKLAEDCEPVLLFPEQPAMRVTATLPSGRTLLLEDGFYRLV